MTFRNMHTCPKPRKWRPAPDYFQQYRPKGDSIHAKCSCAMLAAAQRPISLPEVLFLKFSGPALWEALAAKMGRST